MKIMKYFGLMMSFAFILTGTFMLSGCNASNFDTDKLSIVKEFTYDGNSHILEIAYEDVDLNVTYSTTLDGEYKPASEFAYKNAGEYELYYKISASGYNDYVCSEPVKFEIEKRTVTVNVDNVNKMYKDRAKADFGMIAPENNAEDVVIGEDDLNLSFAIGNKAGTQTAFVASNVAAGDKYDIVATYDNDNYDVTFKKGQVLIKGAIEIANPGEDVRYIDSIDEAALYADLEKGAVITLYEDFEYQAGAVTGDDIRLTAAAGTDYVFTIDLNGHNVGYRFTFTNFVSKGNYTGGKINATIKNGNIGDDTNITYGLTVFGNGDVEVKMENLNVVSSYYGFSGNGNCDGAKVSAEDCMFHGIEAGAYTPSRYTYAWENCSFVGRTGYYAKSGYHTLTNCDLRGNKTTYQEPTYNGNGTDATGSAIVIDSAEGYMIPMNVTLDGCTFNSIAGYCIEEFSTVSSGDENCYAHIQVINPNYGTRGQSWRVFSENHSTASPIIEGVATNHMLAPNLDKPNDDQ